MLKLLNKFQKYVLWSFCLVGVAMLIVTLCYMTKYVYILPENVGKCPETAIVYPLLEKANNCFLIVSLCIIVLFAIVCIFGNKYRKKYYVSNLVAGVSASSIGLILTVISMVLNIKALSSLNENFEALDKFNKTVDLSGKYALDTVWPTVGLVVTILALLVFAVNIAFTIVKYILSKNSDNKVYLD